MEYYSICMKIDEKDRAILQELGMDAKQTTSKLSKKLHIPITTVHNRIKKLEKEKIILNYTLNLDHNKLGKPVPAYIGISVNYQAGSGSKRINQVDVAEEIRKIDGIQEVKIMTGGSDILVKVLARDIPELNEIVTEKLRNVLGVDKTQTSIVLKEV